MTWQEGRQGTGYRKMLLARGRWPLPFDLWLLHFPEGSEVPWHQDPVPEGSHHRINLDIVQARSGGLFETPAGPDTRRVRLFRPDNTLHRVTRIDRGSRWLLSFGWIR